MLLPCQRVESLCVLQNKNILTKLNVNSFLERPARTWFKANKARKRRDQKLEKLNDFRSNMKFHHVPIFQDEVLLHLLSVENSFTPNPGES